MISVLLVLLLFFVGVSESGGIFWRATNCESPLVYCVRDRLYTFCVDFKDFTVRWKFHLECLSRSSCFYGDFPCKASPRLPDFHPRNESRENVDGTTSSPSSSITYESRDVPSTSSRSTVNSREAITMFSYIFDRTMMLEADVPTTEPIIDDPSSVLTYPVLPKTPISSHVRPSSSSAKTIMRAMASSDVFDETTMEQMEVQTTEDPVVLTTEIQSKPTPPTACNSTGCYPGPSCKEYYECIVVWWWFDLRLRFCAEGFAFSVANRTCVPTADSDCLN